MRLIQNMCTIAEYPAPGSTAADCCLGAAGRRLVKIAVVGASGVGKTGESKRGTRLVEGRDVGDPLPGLERREVGVASGILRPFMPLLRQKRVTGAQSGLLTFGPE